MNDACEEYNGFNFKTTRRNGKIGLEKQIHKYVLPWMITHSEALVKKSVKRSAVTNVVTKVKRWNCSTYNVSEKLRVKKILSEIDIIDKLKESLIKHLNDLPEKGKNEQYVCVNIKLNYN